MKNSKRILSVLLSVIVMAAMTALPVSAASYSDVSGKSCETAVDVLSGLNVVNGYNENGKTLYKPDNTVTRAEMAKLLVTAMGKTSQMDSADTGFKDVPASHWAAKYVAFASAKGIISGYGNGQFGPSDTVTYDQAMKMIVGALGYTGDCNEMKGQWDQVYPAKAGELGISKGISGSGSTGATRGDCAIMLYNALYVANVYAGLDGSVNLMPGTSSVVFNGQTTTAATWIKALTPQGGEKYMILSADDVNGAVLSGLSDKTGTAAKVFVNNRGKIISYSESITTLLSGTVSSDSKSFTAADGTKYSFSDAQMMRFASADDGSAVAADYLPYLYNGVLSSTVNDARSYSGEVAVINKGALYTINSADISSMKDAVAITGKCTLAVKTDGKSITEIWSVNRTPEYSGRTLRYEITSSTNPVLYWSVDSVKAGKTVTLTLNPTEAGKVSYIVDEYKMDSHVATESGQSLNKGPNTYTIDISKYDIPAGGTYYIHLGFTGVSGAHMVTTVEFKNSNY